MDTGELESVQKGRIIEMVDLYSYRFKHFGGALLRWPVCMGSVVRGMFLEKDAIVVDCH